jgi:hypothetical protein
VCGGGIVAQEWVNCFQSRQNVNLTGWDRNKISIFIILKSKKIYLKFGKFRKTIRKSKEKRHHTENVGKDEKNIMYENKTLTPYPTSLGKEFRENVMTKNNVLCVVEISLTPSPTITQLFLFTLVIIAYV